MKEIAEALRALIESRTRDIEKLGDLFSRLYMEYTLMTIIAGALVFLLLIALGHAIYSIYRYKRLYKGFKKTLRLELRRFYNNY